MEQLLPSFITVSNCTRQQSGTVSMPGAWPPYISEPSTRRTQGVGGGGGGGGSLPTHPKYNPGLSISSPQHDLPAAAAN